MSKFRQVVSKKGEISTLSIRKSIAMPYLNGIRRFAPPATLSRSASEKQRELLRRYYPQGRVFVGIVDNRINLPSGDTGVFVTFRAASDEYHRQGLLKLSREQADVLRPGQEINITVTQINYNPGKGMFQFDLQLVAEASKANEPIAPPPPTFRRLGDFYVIPGSYFDSETSGLIPIRNYSPKMDALADIEIKLEGQTYFLLLPKGLDGKLSALWEAAREKKEVELQLVKPVDSEATRWEVAFCDLPNIIIGLATVPKDLKPNPGDKLSLLMLSYAGKMMNSTLIHGGKGLLEFRLRVHHDFTQTLDESWQRLSEGKPIELVVATPPETVMGAKLCKLALPDFPDQPIGQILLTSEAVRSGQTLVVQKNNSLPGLKEFREKSAAALLTFDLFSERPNVENPTEHDLELLRNSFPPDKELIGRIESISDIKGRQGAFVKFDDGTYEYKGLAYLARTGELLGVRQVKFRVKRVFAYNGQARFDLEVIAPYNVPYENDGRYLLVPTEEPMGESFPGRTYQTRAIINDRFLDLLNAQGVGAFTRTHYYVDRLIARGHLYVPHELVSSLNELFSHANNCGSLLKVIGVFENDSHRVIQIGAAAHPELGKIGTLLLPKGADLSLLRTSTIELKTDQYHSNSEPFHAASDGSLIFELDREHDPEIALMAAFRELEQTLTGNLPVKLVLRRRLHDFLHMENQWQEILSILDDYGSAIRDQKGELGYSLQEWSVGLPGHSEIEIGRALIPHGQAGQAEVELLLMSRSSGFFERSFADDARYGKLRLVDTRVMAFLADPLANPLSGLSQSSYVFIGQTESGRKGYCPKELYAETENYAETGIAMSKHGRDFELMLPEEYYRRLVDLWQKCNSGHAIPLVAAFRVTEGELEHWFLDLPGPGKHSIGNGFVPASEHLSPGDQRDFYLVGSWPRDRFIKEFGLLHFRLSSLAPDQSTDLSVSGPRTVPLQDVTRAFTERQKASLVVTNIDPQKRTFASQDEAKAALIALIDSHDEQLKIVITATAAHHGGKVLVHEDQEQFAFGQDIVGNPYIFNVEYRKSPRSHVKRGQEMVLFLRGHYKDNCFYAVDSLR